MRRLVVAPLVRGSAAILVAVLVSAVALAAPRTAQKQPCCMSAGTAGDAPCCCMGDDSPSGSSAGCCRMSAPEEAAPSLTSPAAPVLTAPASSSVPLALPTLSASLEAHACRVAPRARAAPLHLLYSTLLV